MQLIQNHQRSHHPPLFLSPSLFPDMMNLRERGGLAVFHRLRGEYCVLLCLQVHTELGSKMPSNIQYEERTKKKSPCPRDADGSHLHFLRHGKRPPVQTPGCVCV